MSLSDRFWSKVSRGETGECWTWTGCTNAEGYGRIFTKESVQNAHRVSWKIANGDIPRDLVVRHRCDNPSCVNPDHLELGTHADNARDKAIRRRTKRKVSDADVRAIRAEKGRYRLIANRYGVSVAYVCRVKQGSLRKEHV